MNIDITIPSNDVTIDIRSIKLLLGDNKAIVEVWNDGTERNRYEVDLSEMIISATSTQLTVIKGFLKSIIASALDLKVGDIPNTVFKQEG